MTSSFFTNNQPYLNSNTKNKIQYHSRTYSNINNNIPVDNKNRIMEFKNSFGDIKTQNEGRKTYMGHERPDYFNSQTKNKNPSMSLRNLNNFGYLTDIKQNQVNNSMLNNTTNLSNMFAQEYESNKKSHFRKKYKKDKANTAPDYEGRKTVGFQKKKPKNYNNSNNRSVNKNKQKKKKLKKK